MAKKTAPFPTGEDLHALLVSRDKLDDLKTHTINYLTTLSQKAATPHGKRCTPRKSQSWRATVSSRRGT